MKQTCTDCLQPHPSLRVFPGGDFVCPDCAKIRVATFDKISRGLVKLTGKIRSSSSEK
jgi:hypothetical protein